MDGWMGGQSLPNPPNLRSLPNLLNPLVWTPNLLVWATRAYAHAHRSQCCWNPNVGLLNRCQCYSNPNKPDI